MRLLDKEKLKNNIEKIATYDLKENNVFGSSYFVMQNGEVVFKKHFGTTGIDGKNKVDDGTIYRLASMTKPITSVAILILSERGLVSLEDPVCKYLPELRDIHITAEDGTDLGVTKTKITILHCLTHTSGFGSGRVFQIPDEDRKNIQITIKYLTKAGLEFEPFTKQSYSPFGAFDILAAIVEKVTNKDYEEFLKQEIFDPCNMTDTTFMPSETQWKRIITMHNKVDGKNDIGITHPGCIFDVFPAEHKLAGAGLVSTLNDYSNFAQMLLNKGKAPKKQIVSPETLSKMSKQYLTKELEFADGSETWGLGVRIIAKDIYKKLPVGTFGWSGAYGSHFWIDPENNLCAVFMKNSKFDGGSGNNSAQRFEKAVFDALIK